VSVRKFRLIPPDFLFIAILDGFLKIDYYTFYDSRTNFETNKAGSHGGGPRQTGNF